MIRMTIRGQIAEGSHPADLGNPIPRLHFEVADAEGRSIIDTDLPLRADATFSYPPELASLPVGNYKQTMEVHFPDGGIHRIGSDKLTVLPQDP